MMHQVGIILCINPYPAKLLNFNNMFVCENFTSDIFRNIFKPKNAKEIRKTISVHTQLIIKLCLGDFLFLNVYNLRGTYYLYIVLFRYMS